MPVRPREHRSRRYKPFDLHKGFLLSVAPLVSPILFSERCQWLSDRSEIFQKLPVPRSHPHEASKLLQILGYRKIDNRLDLIRIGPKSVSVDEYAEVLNLGYPENTLLTVDRQPRFL